MTLAGGGAALAIFTSYARWPSLADALLDRGYRPDEVAKILGGNAQRVFQRVGKTGTASRAGAGSRQETPAQVRVGREV
jgi:hypothetical protein